MPPFETIYHQYFRFVWISARRLGVHVDAMDDVVQEVFLVIYSKLHTIRDPAALRSWIYGVVRRTASAHRRKQRADQETAEMDTFTIAAPGPHEDAEQHARLLLLGELLNSLSEQKREIFVLVELEEMSVPEVAAALEIPLNTAYSRLRLAREDFETALGRRERSTVRGVSS